MSGIVGSKLNIRGSGPVAKLGTDGQHLLSSGAGKSVSYETVASTAYDDNKVQANIALLGFKAAVNNDLAKYNLVDQIVDEYEDATGVDAGASTNERLTSGVYDGAAGSDPTGGASTDTSVSGFKTHVFTSNAALSVGSSGNVTILVVGGGGAGGDGYGGGGGAGGLIYKATHALTANTYDAVIGGGGASVSDGSTENNGVDSTWTINGGAVEFTAKGGGSGGSGSVGVAGGSGGGNNYSSATAAAGNQTSQSGDSGTYGFGNAGGVGTGGHPNYNVGGGGGAGAVGSAGTSSVSGAGGVGKNYSSIFGTAVGASGWFAGGGGGVYVPDGGSGVGAGGTGGGGSGAVNFSSNGTAGTANTGGGGGGSGLASGAGGSGVILVRYADDAFIASGGNLTLQSTDTTASTANPDYADMIILMENAEGTATLNTDIKGYISEDSGVTFTQGTLVDEGTWGTNKKIIAFHDLDISAQSGSAMCYKITTHNQSAGSKETKIHATSIGWK